MEKEVNIVADAISVPGTLALPEKVAEPSPISAMAAATSLQLPARDIAGVL
jgi:hypothetical protein